jgi:phosphate transport system substrate-binding protein
MKTSKLFLILPLIGMLSCGKAKLMIKELKHLVLLSVTIKGSDTVLPLAQKREELMKTNSDVSVTVVGGGSGVGITAMIEVLLISQWLQETEEMKFADEKWRLSKL